MSGWPLIIVAVALCTTGCGLIENACIEKVLEKDSEIGHSKASVTARARQMRALEMGGCPGDFRVAYHDHVRAWEDLAVLEGKADSLHKPEGFWDGVGEGAKALGIISSVPAAEQKIKDTFKEVERIAAFHGAKLPPRQ